MTRPFCGREQGKAAATKIMPTWKINTVEAGRVSQNLPTGSVEDWNHALPHVLADITAQVNPERRDRTCPRAVTRARHNSYRVKKPDEPASIRHDGPPTIHIHALAPRAA